MILQHPTAGQDVADLLIAAALHPWAVTACVGLLIGGCVAIVWIRTGDTLVVLQHRLEDRETSLRAVLTDLAHRDRELAALRVQAHEAGLPVTAPAENVPPRKGRR